jgi:tRNA(Ile)-lysidine synthase
MEKLTRSTHSRDLGAVLRKTIHKDKMLGPADRVLIGVSGGADSVCLALCLKDIGYDIGIAHVNHGLRGADSDEDERFTSALAQQLEVPYFSRRVVLVSGNIEAAGREARRDFFAEIADRYGFARIALAHTRNDRVETFLLNLIRGAGSEGLVSMSPVSGRTIRPLIEVTRNDIEAYLQTRNQTWRTDESNLNPAYVRNGIRHIVIPELTAQFNPRLVETLTRTVDILEGEDDWMGSLTEEWLIQNGTKQADSFVVRSEALKCAPVALQRRAVRAALRKTGSNLQDLAFEHVEAVRGLAVPGKSGKKIQIPGGIEVAREFGNLVFRQAVEIVAEYEYQLQIPGRIHIPELRKVFRAEIVESEAAETTAQRVFVDAESVGPCVRIRNWKPGDYYRPVGLPAGKLKKLFQRARIPRCYRTSWPVIVADSTIIWVASFPVSREFAPRGRSQKIVAFEASEI